MDVTHRSYRDLTELIDYCRCVAGSIGRLSLGVFDPPLRGDDVAEAKRLANTLGVALQLTNILRDIREDLAAGRVYLPRRGSRAVRRRAADDGRRLARPAGRPARGTHPVRGCPGRRALRRGVAAAADAGLAERRLRGSDGRHLSRTAHPHCRRPHHRHARTSRSADARTSSGWRPGRWRGGAPHGYQRHRCRRRAQRDRSGTAVGRCGRNGSARRRAPATRRSCFLLPAGRSVDRQRPARIPALLRGVPRAGSPPRRREQRRAPAQIVHSHPGAGWPECEAVPATGRASAAAPLGRACRIPPAVGNRTGAGSCGRAGVAPARSGQRGARRADPGRLSSGSRADRCDHHRAVGCRRYGDAQPEPERGVACPCGEGIPHRPARPRAGVRRRVRRHAARRAAFGCARLRRWTLPASRCCSPTERNGSSPSMPG